MFTFFQASMVSGSFIFSAGCALTYITINKVTLTYSTINNVTLTYITINKVSFTYIKFMEAVSSGDYFQP